MRVPLDYVAGGPVDSAIGLVKRACQYVPSILRKPSRVSGQSSTFASDAGYGDPRSARVLRLALADYLASDRGLAASPDEILVTRGSQMGLFLAAAAVIDLGQAIAVEVPGYPLVDGVSGSRRQNHRRTS